MEDQLFNLRFCAKQMGKDAKKAEKSAKDNKKKLKKLLDTGNEDGARIYAQNAIRMENQAQNLHRISSRVEAVACRLDSALKMNAVTRSLAAISNTMGVAAQSMDLGKIVNVMDDFEKQFEDLDVMANTVEKSMNSTTSLSTPESDVERLIAQARDENHADFSAQMAAVGAPAAPLAAQAAPAASEVMAPVAESMAAAPVAPSAPVGAPGAGAGAGAAPTSAGSMDSDLEARFARLKGL